MSLSRQFNSQAGFSLIEIAIVLGILALLLALFAGMSTNLISQHRRELTRTRLANIDTALTLFVSQYKRLPCPALGTPGATGLENATTGTPPGTLPRSCVNNQQDGVVPWSTLGLAASDIEDGWGGRFTYRVGPDLVMENAMDFSSCDPAGQDPPTGPLPLLTPPYCNQAGAAAGNCNAGSLSTLCTPPKTALTGAPGKGLVVEDIAGNVIMDPCFNRATSPPALVSTGAAYMLISHGADGGGAYSSQGIVQGSSTAAGTMEAKNFPALPYPSPYPSPTVCPALVNPTSFLVDDAYNATVVGHFDDFVSRPNVLTVATRAQLGPRAHN